MELWSIEHLKTLLPATVIYAVIAFVLRVLLIKKDIKIRMIPFQVLAVILFALEVGKQVISFKRGYDLYHLPFHFCSLFIFMLPLTAFYRGKGQNCLRAVTMSLCMAVFFLMMLYPCLIYSGGNVLAFFKEYMSFHTVAFHNIVIFEFFIMLFLELYKPEDKKTEQRAVVIFMLVFVVIAAVMAQILKTNYANMYHCNVPPAENIRIMMQGKLGYAVAQIIYVAIVGGLHTVFTWLSYLVCRGLMKLLARRKKNAN